MWALPSRWRSAPACAPRLAAPSPTSVRAVPFAHSHAGATPRSAPSLGRSAPVARAHAARRPAGESNHTLVRSAPTQNSNGLVWRTRAGEIEDKRFLTASLAVSGGVMVYGAPRLALRPASPDSDPHGHGLMYPAICKRMPGDRTTRVYPAPLVFMAGCEPIAKGWRVRHPRRIEGSRGYARLTAQTPSPNPAILM